MVKVELTKNFANKKSGEILEVDSMLASTLVRQKKVAKYTPEELEKQAKRKAKAEAEIKREQERRIKEAKAQKEANEKAAKAHAARLKKETK